MHFKTAILSLSASLHILMAKSMSSFEAIPVEEEYIADETEIVIEKNKKFEMRPMDPEEAVMQMELVGHEFFVFLNSQNDKVSVVYKRKNGNYGLIEPEN